MRASANHNSASSGIKQIEQARKIVPVVSVQNRYSVSDRGAEDVLEYCGRASIGFIPWFPLAAGKLSGTASGLKRAADTLDRLRKPAKAV